jgi:hypothetical protein
MIGQHGIPVLLLLGLLAGPAMAADPPPLLNYQGVLRDVADNPVDGPVDMQFRFWSAETGGDEILVNDQPQVLVSGGLFNAALGSGPVWDGTGPGSYTTLAEIFRDYDSVWLEVEVASETLSPRIRVLAAAYALNAGSLGGYGSSDFVKLDYESQIKQGNLTVNGLSPGIAHGLVAYGSGAGVYAKDFNNSGEGWLGVGDTGVRGFGSAAGGYFSDTNGSGLAELAKGDRGIEGYGMEMGGYFKDSNHSGYARVGFGDHGIEALGNTAGGYFKDIDNSGDAYIGLGDRGIQAHGSEMGGYFGETDTPAYAQVAHANFGIKGFGDEAGGYFKDTNASSEVWVGRADNGISSYGSQMGGYFSNTDVTAYARLASKEGEFDNGYGIHAFGWAAGGYFEDADASGYALVGHGDYGIEGFGTYGGRFSSTTGGGVALVGYFDTGMGGYGDNWGVGGWDNDSGTYGHIAHDSASTDGNGSKNFVQNHPYEEDKVVVYSSLEGDEVGTYTRGTARLEGGLARVRLGETFAWVTNPDIGLTAHLTPRGTDADLYVESLTTEELVVRAADGSTGDVACDYLVLGLRIGFEESSVVREKEMEARIPSMAGHRRRYERSPELKRFNALERFKSMRAATVETEEPLDLSASQALKAAIEEFDPAIHSIGPDLPPGGTPQRRQRGLPRESAADAHAGADVITDGDAGSSSPGGSPRMDDDGNVYARSFRPSASDLASMVAVGEPVEAGDVVALDPDRPGLLTLARIAGDSAVFGVVATEPGVVLGSTGGGSETGSRNEAPRLDVSSSLDSADDSEIVETAVAFSGVVLCKVDAGFGSVRPGDLLTTSPTPGHAMRAADPRPGTILGKALEPLEHDTGLIRVLVMLR